MSNKKLWVAFGLVIGLLLSATAVGQAAYQDEFSSIFPRASNSITNLGNDATAMSNDTMSMSTGLERARDYKRQAFKQLKEIVQLTPQAPNVNLQIRAINLISAWYTTSELWRKGLAEYDTKSMKAAKQVMDYVIRETRQITSKIQK